MKYLAFLLIFFVLGKASAQRVFNSTKKISNAHGTLFASWGYNRSFYSESDIKFDGKWYDYTLFGVDASDQKPAKISDYFAASTMFRTQFNFRVGYHYMNKYALLFAYDRLNYVMDDANAVVLDGSVDTSLHATWSGKHKNEHVVTNRNDFHYANVGMHLLQGGIQRTDKLYQSKNKQFSFSTSYGIQLGAVISNNTFLFNQDLQNRKSLSGFTMAAFANARFEFFKSLFVQAQLTGGSINNFKVKTSTIELDNFAKNQFWYGQHSISLGFFKFFKPVNACNTCPVW